VTVTVVVEGVVLVTGFSFHSGFYCHHNCEA
jgi:hypothetical protein